MTEWTTSELDRIGGAEELHIASRREDGTLRPSVTIWAVRLGDGVFVRSAYGPENPWFVRAQRAGTGRIQAGGVERDVVFAAADPSEQEAIDAAYHEKYDSHGQDIVGTVVGEKVHALTLRLTPADSSEGES
ncbi:DUF2255 family protein [Compostimonas suwonensis]|uniref:DUF2255 family protein n=1 Tax=Compostimonas suwonensis TaxID=1048394 RepID=A0A2M9BWK6_9MICO|nr:DUF2255 family protein [Compostimonas suwonensis]PJJ62328.1 hypothetical protein CLV54_2128 [Compostimonas suwonensis]